MSGAFLHRLQLTCVSAESMQLNGDGGLTATLKPEAEGAVSSTQPQPEADGAVSSTQPKPEADGASLQATWKWLDALRLREVFVEGAPDPTGAI